MSCSGYIDLGSARFHCWRKGGHGSLDLRGGLKNSCDVFFYEVARRIGIDRIAAMAHRLGLGTALEIDLPGARSGFVPTREWRIAQGHPWNLGDTVVSGIGQGYIQVTPLQLATYAARVATGRKVEPHLTRRLAGVVQPGAQPSDWQSLGLTEHSLHVVREGMWAVVNEPAAPRRWRGCRIRAGRWRARPDRRRCAACRASSARGRISTAASCPGSFGRTRCSSPTRRMTRRGMRSSVVVEHGNAGAAVAAPIARDIMMDVLQRDPGGRDEKPAAQVAEREAPR